MTSTSFAQLATDLTSVFADNETREITEQDFRDFVTNVLDSVGNHGFATIVDGVTVQALTSTPALVVNWSNRFVSTGVTFASNAYTVVAAGVYEFRAKVRLTSTTGRTVTMYPAVAGVFSTTIKDSAVVDLDTNAILMVEGLLTLTAGQAVSLFAKINTADDITIVDASMSLKRVR